MTACVDCVEGACRAAQAPPRSTPSSSAAPTTRWSAPCCSASWAAASTIVSSGEAIAEEVGERLATPGSANDESRRGNYRFLAHRRPGGSSAALGTRFLQLPIGEVDHVDVDRRRTREARRVSARARARDGRAARTSCARSGSSPAS